RDCSLVTPPCRPRPLFCLSFNDTATPEIHTLSLHDALPISGSWTPKLLAPHGIDVPITAMRLQVVETEPAPFRFAPLLYGPTALKQYAFIRELPSYSDIGTTHPLEATFDGLEFLELAVQREDGRLLLGCPMDFPGL